MLIDSFCPWCAVEEADFLHVFRDCCVARQLWALAHLSSFTIPAEELDIVAWVQRMLAHVGDLEAEQIAVIP